MSNVFDAHPWLNGIVGAVAMAIANAGVSRLRRVFSSPGREELQALEARLRSQIAELQSNVTEGMRDLQGQIAQLGQNVYKRLDEKTDALNGRIDDLVSQRSGGR